MKKNKKRILKFLTLIGATSFIIATPIITTSCSSKNTEPSKINLEINSAVTTVGAIDALITNDSETAMKTISDSLTKNPDKLIQNYDAVKDKLGDDFTVVASVDSKPEQDKWGKTPYSEWKNNTSSFYKTTTIEEVYYSPSLEPITVSSKNDFHVKLNEKLTNILKTSDSSKFSTITEATINKEANIGFSDETNLLHVKVDVTDNKASMKESKEEASGDSSQKSYDLCIPASEIDLKIDQLKVEVSGSNINTTSKEIGYTYEIGIDGKVQPKSIEISHSNSEKPTVDEVLNQLQWTNNTVQASKTSELNNDKIASDLCLYNVTFSNPEIVEDSEKGNILKLKATPENSHGGFSWEDGSKGEKTINAATITITKEKIKLKNTINLIGSLNDVFNTSNIDFSKISNALSNKPNEVIENYDDGKCGPVNITIKDTNSPDSDNKWGQIKYEEWNKKDSLELEQYAEEKITLDKMYYKGEKLEITSLNDLHDKISENIKEIVSSKEGEVDSSTYSIVQNTALYADIENDLIHVNIQKNSSTGTGAIEEKNKNSIEKFDFCIPASFITYKINNADITASGDKIETANITNGTLSISIGSKCTTNYVNNNDIILGKDQSKINFKPSLNATLVAMGWAEYSKKSLEPQLINKVVGNDGSETQKPGESVPPLQETSIKIKNHIISQELGLYNVNFTAKDFKQNDSAKSDKTYKFTLEAEPMENFTWSDGTKDKKEFIIDNLKLFTRAAILISNEKSYKDKQIEIDNLDNIETFIKTNIDNITEKIQTDLLTPQKISSIKPIHYFKNSVSSQYTVQFLFKGVIKLNAEETKSKNNSSKIETINDDETKEIKLVFDVNAEDGFVFFDDNLKQKQLTVTLSFKKKNNRNKLI